MSAVTVSATKFHGVVQVLFLYQPPKAKESFTRAVGFAIVLPCSTLIGATGEPPYASKVTVYAVGVVLMPLQLRKTPNPDAIRSRKRTPRNMFRLFIMILLRIKFSSIVIPLKVKRMIPFSSVIRYTL